MLHRTVLLVRVATDNIPLVAGPDRIKWRDLGHGFWQIDAHFGFAQTPNVPRELRRAEIPGSISLTAKSPIFVGRANVKSTPRPGMARWREHLYVFLSSPRHAHPRVFPHPRPTKSSSSAPRSKSEAVSRSDLYYGRQPAAGIGGPGLQRGPRSMFCGVDVTSEDEVDARFA